LGSADTDQWLEKVYHAGNREDLLKLYERWADTYDADLQHVGYLHAPVITGLVARFVPDRTSAILDAGVGTGAIGHILSIIGYGNLSGIDMSEAMLAKAGARGCYGDLRRAVLGETLDFADGRFDAIISTGTFTNGHAPASAFDELARILKPGGYLMFTVGTVIWEEQGFRQKLGALEAHKQLLPVETSAIYAPMPYSPLESGFTTRAHIYRRG